MSTALYERLDYRGTWTGTTEADPRNFTYDVSVTLWDCEEPGICAKVYYPDVYDDENPPPASQGPEPCQGSWELLYPKGTPATSETEFDCVGPDPDARVCSDLLPEGVERGDDFGDCWGFLERMPADSQCYPIPFCRSQTEELSDADCEEDCIFNDTGNCPTDVCICIDGPIPPVDFVLLSPTQAYYRWGGNRVLAYLERACPQNDYTYCIETCPPQTSDDYGLCLESCEVMCPADHSVANDKGSGDSSASAGLTAGIVVAAAAAVGVVVAVTAYRARNSESTSGHVYLIDPAREGTQVERALESVDASSVQSFEIASV